MAVVAVNYNYFLVSVMVLLPALCVSQDTFTCSRATYYGSPDCLGTASGACGYREYGRTVNNGYVTGVSKLYRNGTGCGACYQVRCKVPNLCTDNGVNVVVTDYGEGDDTDFILSASAYTRMAQPNLALELVAYGTVDVEYRRISCQYPNTNLMFKVHEDSRFPEYIALVPLYQAGQTEITVVELWQEDCQEWRGMRRAYGAVWDMSNPPSGPLSLRFQASSTNGEWVQLKDVIPSDWKAGVAYDSAFQLS